MNALALRTSFSWNFPGHRLVQVLFHPNRRWLYALTKRGGGLGQAKLHGFDLRTHDKLGEAPLGDLCPCLGVEALFTPRSLWLHDNHGVAVSVGLETWKVRKLHLQLRDPLPSHLLADGRMIGQRGQELIVSNRHGGTIHRLRQRSGTITDLAVHPDGHTVLTGSSGSVVSVWDVDEGRCLGRFRRHTRRVEAVAFSLHGETAFSSSAAGEVFHWNVSRARLFRRLPVDGLIRGIGAHPDGRHVLLVGWPAFELMAWDLTARKLAHRWTVPQRVERFALHRDRIVLLQGNRFDVLRVKALAAPRPAM